MASAPPDDFLKTVQSIQQFQNALVKLNKGSKADVNVELNRDDCLALLWAMELLRDGSRRTGTIADGPIRG